MIEWLEVVWILLCIRVLSRLLPLSLLLRFFFLLACFFAGYVLGTCESAAKRSEAVEVLFCFPSSVAGYRMGRTLEDCWNSCAFLFLAVQVVFVL